MLPRVAAIVLLALPRATRADCGVGDFALINFNTSLVRSNLGGAGGRCSTPGLCEELQTAVTPHEVYISRVTDLGKLRGRNETSWVDLRITNETEYRAWNPNINGIRNAESGAFGAINLLSPRSPRSPRFWRQDMTYVQLRFEFIEASTAAAVALPRTFFTFCAHATCSTRTPAPRSDVQSSHTPLSSITTAHLRPYFISMRVLTANVQTCPSAQSIWTLDQPAPTASAFALAASAATRSTRTPTSSCTARPRSSRRKA